MASLKLAANTIPGTSDYFTHLQIVYDDGFSLLELEVQAPVNVTLGYWQFDDVKDHTASTNYGVQGHYNITDIDLGDRDASAVWSILKAVNTEYISSGIQINYDLYQNSNSYVNTLLNVIGIDLSNYINDIIPGQSSGGAIGWQTDVLNQSIATGNGPTYIDLNFMVDSNNNPVLPTASKDFIRGGDGDDTFSSSFGLYNIGGDVFEGGGGNDYYAVTSSQTINRPETESLTYNSNYDTILNETFSLADASWNQAVIIRDSEGSNNLNLAARATVFRGDHIEDFYSSFDFGGVELKLEQAGSGDSGGVPLQYYPGYFLDFANYLDFTQMGDVYGVVTDNLEMYLPDDMREDGFQGLFATYGGDDLYIWSETVFEMGGSVSVPIAILEEFNDANYGNFNLVV